MRSIQLNIPIFITQKGNRIWMSNYATLFTVKKSVINVGIKIHNLPSELKRVENFEVFKNKLKSYYETAFILYKSVFVTMTDSSFVTEVSLDMIGKYTDGLWTVIFTKCVMFSELCFWWFVYCFVFNCWELSSMVGRL
jgi:hypothetical protein